MTCGSTGDVRSEYPDRQPPRRQVPVRAGGTPAQQRDLRAQGRRTVVRLLDAGLKAFETMRSGQSGKVVLDWTSRRNFREANLG